MRRLLFCQQTRERRNGMPKTLAVFMLVLLILIPVSVSAETDLRAIFDEGISWAQSEKKTVKVLDRIKSAGFNTYIPCVWHGQGAIWPSETAELWYKNQPLAQKDPLKHFIKLAHDRHIKVMPCFTIMARQHEFYEQFTTQARKNMFNVQDAEFRRFITRVVLEVVKNYDIDGINLDYVRAGQVCFEQSCRKSYKQFSGKDLMADLALHKLNQKARKRIVSWQRRAVRSLIYDISTKARKLKPDLKITVCAAPWADSVEIEGQNSIGWAEDRLIDTVFSMNYQREIPWKRLSKERAKLSKPESLVIMVANYNQLTEKKKNGKRKIKPKTAEQLQAVVKKAIEFQGSGSYAVYLYSQLTDVQIAGMRIFLDQLASSGKN